MTSRDHASQPPCSPSEKKTMMKGKQLLTEEQNHEWDANDWRWDKNLFTAERLNTSQMTEESKNPSEKRRKASGLAGDEFGQADGTLTLNLGVAMCSSMEGDESNYESKNVKRLKAEVLPKVLLCQVDDCYANLNDAKHYHKRHKVCEMHAKCGSVLLRGLVQRFCQQCSRFHIIREFDEEKRSCRRRLAGHNRRRRKNNLVGLMDHSSGYNLISLLRILSNLHTASNLEQSKDHNLLFQLLKVLSCNAGRPASNSVCGLPESIPTCKPSMVPVEKTPPLLSGATSSTTALLSKNTGLGIITTSKPMDVAEEVYVHKTSHEHAPSFPSQHNNSSLGLNEIHSRTNEVLGGGSCSKHKLNDFDLNIMSTDIHDYKQENGEKIQGNCSRFSREPYQNMGQKIPPHSGGNYEPTSAKLLPRSSEDVECATDRIIFKLFGKEPSDLPPFLRAQILSWLLHSPTDIESYIRPGCVVLSIYLRLQKHMWKELCSNLTANLKRLLEPSDNMFWRSGWIYAKVRHQIAFIYNGQVLVDTTVLRSDGFPFVLDVAPIAVPTTNKAPVFTVKVNHLYCPSTKFICAFNGKQSVHEIRIHNKEDDDCSSSDCSESLCIHTKQVQAVSFTCFLSNKTGRGFIEVDLHDLSCEFVPFIVADIDICTEIRSLECSIQVTDSDFGQLSSRDEDIEFLQEFGWLLERKYLSLDISIIENNEFSSVRFKWLLEFSVERDWCAVVRKILDILFSRILVHDAAQLILAEVNLLHRGVRRNCRAMVKSLLNYSPEAKWDRRPFNYNTKGPGGITPLHIAASTVGTDDVLGLLTDDPDWGWVQTWENDLDEAGFTPADYASQRGHDHYIQFVQRKRSARSEPHFIFDMSSSLPQLMIKIDSTDYKQKDGGDGPPLQNMKQKKCHCGQISYYHVQRRVLHYRPAILSMVAIAAVCVCVGILLKSPPKVLYVEAFLWERLDFGYI